MQLYLLRTTNSCPDVENTLAFIKAMNQFIASDAVQAKTELMGVFDKMLTDYADVFNRRQVKYTMIEGNIGAGKSTLLAKLAAAEGAPSDPPPTGPIIVPEPLAFWNTLLVEQDGQIQGSVFEKFYKELALDKTRFVVIFQLVALFTRIVTLLHQIRTYSQAVEFFSERSFLSDRLFFEINKDKCHPEDTDLYFACHELCSNRLDQLFESRLFFYFHRAEPNITSVKEEARICLVRVRNRNRAGEDAITEEYLETLGQAIVDFEKSINSNFILSQDDLWVLFKNKL